MMAGHVDSSGVTPKESGPDTGRDPLAGAGQRHNPRDHCCSQNIGNAVFRAHQAQFELPTKCQGALSYRLPALNKLGRLGELDSLLSEDCQTEDMACKARLDSESGLGLGQSMCLGTSKEESVCNLKASQRERSTWNARRLALKTTGIIPITLHTTKLPTEKRETAYSLDETVLGLFQLLQSPAEDLGVLLYGTFPRCLV